MPPSHVERIGGTTLVTILAEVGVPDDIQRDVGDVLGAVRPQVANQA